MNNGISVEQLARAMRLGKLGEPIVIKSKFAFSRLKYEGFDIAEKDRYYVLRKARDDEANQLYWRILEEESDGLYIQDIMRTGRCEIDRKYYDIAKTEIEAFCERVYNSIREYEYNLSTTPIVFVGGGAVVMKLFGGINQSNITYITDIRANAKGYEQLALMALRKMKKLA